jgi:hypothetical protein
MSVISIPLDGKPTDIERKPIPLDLVILDIENPRIQYHLDTRLNDDITQEKVRFALAEGNEQYEKLKAHIEINGGIYNPIWVVPEGDFYKVIEGNSRSLAYSDLADKYVNDERWMTINAYILPRAVERHKINFIRLEAHLFGPTPWDAYEKARELYRLSVEEDYSEKRLSLLTKLSPYDIRNNIQAFRDMEDQYLPKYRKPSERLKFSYFAEFRKNKDLNRLVREGKMSLLDFCDLVGEGKLGRGEDVRRLGMVWRDDQARDVLLEEDMEAALDQLSQKNPAAKSKLFEKIDAVSSGLENMAFAELDEIRNGLQPAKVEALKRLHTLLTNLLRSIGVLH